ncbi:MAG: hypothetical protein FJ125_04810 [Deltaproteobacteria bacterium]|nr:hypothetical protein [Deltaproteobacteria bacterium]
MRVKAQDPQQPGEPGQAALDDLLQVGDPSEAPAFEARGVEHAHPDQDVDRCDNLASGEQQSDGGDNARVERVAPIDGDADSS